MTTAMTPSDLSPNSPRRLATLAPVMAMCLIGLLVSGCSDFRKAIGTEKSSPDEFEVVVRPPLALPPSFAATSEELENEPAAASGVSTSTDARSVAAATLGVLEGGAGEGYEQIFNFAAIDEDVRRLVDEETYGIQLERRVPFQVLLGGVPDIGPIIDKVAEDQRLRRTMREGLLPTDGGTTAIDLQTEETLTIGE